MDQDFGNLPQAPSRVGLDCEDYWNKSKSIKLTFRNFPCSSLPVWQLRSLPERCSVREEISARKKNETASLSVVLHFAPCISCHSITPSVTCVILVVSLSCGGTSLSRATCTSLMSKVRHCFRAGFGMLLKHSDSNYTHQSKAWDMHKYSCILMSGAWLYTYQSLYTCKINLWNPLKLSCIPGIPRNPAKIHRDQHLVDDKHPYPWIPWTLDTSGHLTVFMVKLRLHCMPCISSGGKCPP